MRILFIYSCYTSCCYISRKAQKQQQEKGQTLISLSRQPLDGLSESATKKRPQALPPVQPRSSAGWASGSACKAASTSCAHFLQAPGALRIVRVHPED